MTTVYKSTQKSEFSLRALGSKINLSAYCYLIFNRTKLFSPSTRFLATGVVT